MLKTRYDVTFATTRAVCRAIKIKNKKIKNKKIKK